MLVLPSSTAANGVISYCTNGFLSIGALLIDKNRDGIKTNIFHVGIIAFTNDFEDLFEETTILSIPGTDYKWVSKNRPSVATKWHLKLLGRPATKL
ncbi:hypothetical protein ACFQ22_14080 [Lentilactobacillus raoultii]|uniref:Uncharacterized protein n=1 Tax=Lentilactobacillus raoultii TaxID=1987503 RepID=A0ABW3PK99_9LACO|nr:hypothetical protein [Lentilactobacillus raoultii]